MFHSQIERQKESFFLIFKQKVFYPEENKWITLKVSAAAIRTIDKIGISAALATAKSKGFFK